MKRLIEGLRLFSALLVALVVKQDALTLAIAGAVFVITAKALPYLLSALAIVLPPALMVWAAIHFLLAGVKVGSQFFARLRGV